jgi:serine/threonine protein kinase
MTQRNSRLIGGVYQVGQVITSGPLLTTYTAYNRNTSDVVGLLVSELPQAFDPSAVEQLLAPLGQRRPVQSPHVIRVYDWGISEGKVFIATDPPRGITLRQLTDEENLDLRRSINLATQITRGVATLQASGIFDTDLRPPFITIDTIGLDDRAQLDDVGLRGLLRQLGYIQGENVNDIEYLDPRYMAPEYIFQGIISPGGDVYQLGILLFELVTGRPPFVGRTPAETGIMQSSHPVPRMAQLRNDTPQALQEIVERALAKNPLQRYPHAAALLAALETLPLAPSRRLITSGEWQAVAAPTTAPANDLLPTQRNAGLTVEMASTSTDIPDEVNIGESTSQNNLPETGPLQTGETAVYAYLDFEAEGKPAQHLALKERYAIVGRHDPTRNITPEVDLTELDTQVTVSRQHARIRFEKTFFYIEDLKSRNKTRLGELVLAPLKPELLQHGDIIWFGSVRMIFRVPGQQPAPIPKNLP